MERSERSIFSVFFLCCGVNHIILSQESIHVAAASKTLAEKELKIKKKKKKKKKSMKRRSVETARKRIPFNSSFRVCLRLYCI